MFVLLSQRLICLYCWCSFYNILMLKILHISEQLFRMMTNLFTYLAQVHVCSVLVSGPRVTHLHWESCLQWHLGWEFMPPNKITSAVNSKEATCCMWRKLNAGFKSPYYRVLLQLELMSELESPRRRVTMQIAVPHLHTVSDSTGPG